MRTFIGQLRSRRRRGPLRVASVVVGAALQIAGCSSTTTSPTSIASTGTRATAPHSSSALKPIDRAALQAAVDMTAQQLLVPGAVVLLRTPQGEFTAAYGTTMLGSTWCLRCRLGVRRA
jgi:D-alanyl-D-alanine carboxypeptidase